MERTYETSSRVISGLWWAAKLWVHETLECARWKVAYLLPRQVAYCAFVRVRAANPDAPGDEYVKSAKLFLGGEGR